MTLGSGNIVASACSGGDYYDPREIRHRFRTLRGPARRDASIARSSKGTARPTRRRLGAGTGGTGRPCRPAHRPSATCKRRAVLRVRSSLLPELLPTLLLRSLLLQSLLLRAVGARLQRRVLVRIWLSVRVRVRRLGLSGLRLSGVWLSLFGIRLRLRPPVRRRPYRLAAA